MSTNIIDISHNDISNNKVIQQPQKPLHLYKILDHCGCTLVGLLEYKKLINISYIYICDFCFLAMTRDDYKYILNYFWDDMRYCSKELINHKGWVDERSWYSAMHHLKHSKSKMYENGKQFITNFVLPLEQSDREETQTA